MSPNGFARRLVLIPEPSWRCAVLISLLHGLALISLLLLPLPGVIRLLAGSLILWLGFRAWQRLLGTGRISGIVWRSAERVQLETRDSQMEGRIHRVSCLHPQLIAFTLVSDDGRSRDCLVWPDQLDPDQYRRLYARLKFRHTSGHGNRNRT